MGLDNRGQSYYIRRGGPVPAVAVPSSSSVAASSFVIVVVPWGLRYHPWTRTFGGGSESLSPPPPESVTSYQQMRIGRLARLAETATATAFRVTQGLDWTGPFVYPLQRFVERIEVGCPNQNRKVR